MPIRLMKLTIELGCDLSARSLHLMKRLQRITNTRMPFFLTPDPETTVEIRRSPVLEGKAMLDSFLSPGVPFQVRALSSDFRSEVLVTYSAASL